MGVALRWRRLLDATESVTPATTPTPETIHTTANHPWLTSDRGWAHAGDLHPGEQVVTPPSATASETIHTTANHP